MNSLASMEFLEAQNAFLTVQSTGLSILFAVLLWKLRHRWRDPLYAAVVAIFVFNAPSAVRQALFWYGRAMHPEDPLWTIRGAQGYLIIGMLVLTGIGSLCKMRVFSVDDYGHGPWVTTLALSIIAAMWALWV